MPQASAEKKLILRSTFLFSFPAMLTYSFSLWLGMLFTFSVQDCVGNSKLNSRRERTPVVPWGTLDLRPIEEKAT